MSGRSVQRIRKRILPGLQQLFVPPQAACLEVWKYKNNQFIKFYDININFLSST